MINVSSFVFRFKIEGFLDQTEDIYFLFVLDYSVIQSKIYKII